MPAQQISPSAARRSPWSAATSHALRGKSCGDLLLGYFRRPEANRRDCRPSRCERSHTNECPARAAAGRCDNLCGPAARIACARPRCPSLSRRRCRARRERPPSQSPGCAHGPCRRARRGSSSDESISTCGANRKRSTPSKRTPSTSALAVRSSIVSRSMNGSASGEPLPTTPGQAALCSFGKVFFWVMRLPVRFGFLLGFRSVEPFFLDLGNDF